MHVKPGPRRAPRVLIALSTLFQTAPRAAVLPLVLLDVAALVAGGYAAIVSRRGDAA
jgi:hypothetical protein